MNNKIIVIALSLVSYGVMTKAESQALPKEAVAVVNQVSLPTKLLDQSIKLNVERGKRILPSYAKP